MTSEPYTPISHVKRIWLYVLGGSGLIFLLGPTAIVIPMSFSGGTFLEFPPQEWSLRWYRAYANSFEWRSATLVSLKVATLTALLATPLGTAAAYGLALSRGRLSGAILIALTTPMIVPIIFVAIGTFYLYARLQLLYTITGLVLAHVTLAIPFVIVLVSAGLRNFDLNQELAARSLGASRGRAFFTVTLPQIKFSVISAALLAFLTSFDEVIIALLISGGRNETLTRRMFLSLRDQIDPTIAAISTILIGITICIVLITQLALYERK